MQHRPRNCKLILSSTAIVMIFSIFLIGVTLFQQSTGSRAAVDDLHRRRLTPTLSWTPTVDITPTDGITPTATPPDITPTPPDGTPTVTVTPTPPAGGQTVQLFVEPAAGEQVILNAINSAQKSIWLETYLLTDNNIIQALENAATQKLDVRVMLEPHPYGGGSPQGTLDALKAAGASVEDASPAFHYTHEKGMIIDGTTAYIMTCNFTNSALTGKNREYGIIDTTPQDVQGVIDIFNADWNRTSVQVTDPNLVVSPINARSDFISLINSAKSSLIIEAEEMQDSSVEQAIASAAQRGVQVQVILPTPSSSSGSDPNSAGIAAIKAGGAVVEEDSQLYMHAKMMIIDGTQAFVGSENISTNSLDSNRELGVLVTDQLVLTTLQQTFQTDWSVSQAV